MANEKLETYTISRQELKRILIAFGIGEKSIEQLLGTLEKAHRHVNVVGFAALLEKIGVSRDKTTNVLRRLGLDDVTIQQILDTSDEQRILAESGRLFDVSVDFG